MGGGSGGSYSTPGRTLADNVKVAAKHFSLDKRGNLERIPGMGFSRSSTQNRMNLR